jgi:hypothetical protein
MKIELPNAAAARSLQEYLERCECIVRRIDERTVEAAAPPRSLRANESELELEGYVHTWRALNPEVEFTITSAI